VERSRPARILVADDQPDVIEALRLLLKGAGFQVVPASSPAYALAAVESQDLDAALLDMNYARDTTSGQEGLALVSQIRAADPALPIVVMTAWGSIESAVSAMKLGARDYVEKPWKNERLLTTLRVQVELRSATRRAARLEAQAAREDARTAPGLIFASKAMEAVSKLAARVAESDASVLVTGEHGTGKDVVARVIHAASGRGRASAPFVPVNAGALSEGVFESELFGHVKGAFTDAKADRIGCFELADGGTLFLDEIGTMPVSQQVKLLRVLQSGEFSPVGSSKVKRANVRVISATNIDIAREVSRGTFRDDLLYRLNTVEIHIPPLRDRREDIIALALHFLEKKAARYGKGARKFTDAALAALTQHDWPGNVRELEHVTERAIVLAESDAIDVSALSLRRAPEAGQIERMTLADAEAYLIRKALERTGSAVLAADALGLSRSALYRRLAALGIQVE
jgi:DNA-binding NtrC family response regulator